MDSQALEEATTTTSRTGLIGRWQNVPLYARIVIALVLGVMVGLMLGSEALFWQCRASSCCASSVRLRHH